MKLLRLAILFTAVVGISYIYAQESAFSVDNWHLSLGVSYRDFRKPTFKSSAMPNFTGSFSAAQPDIIAWDPSKYGANSSLEIVNVIHYSGGRQGSRGHYGFEESLAPALGFSLALAQQDNIEFSLVANLQYFSLDSASRHNAFAGGNEYTRLANVINGVAGAEYDEPYGSLNYTSHLSGSAKTKFDLDLYVLDLGLSANYIFQSGLQAYIAAGPSLSLADMESSSFSRVGSAGGALASARGRDNDIDYIFGYYASIGASYWISEQVGLSLELRKDEGFKKAATKYAKQDLDAYGGMLKCIFRF